MPDEMAVLIRDVGGQFDHLRKKRWRFLGAARDPKRIADDLLLGVRSRPVRVEALLQHPAFRAELDANSGVEPHLRQFLSQQVRNIKWHAPSEAPPVTKTQFAVLVGASVAALLLIRRFWPRQHVQSAASATDDYRRVNDAAVAGDVWASTLLNRHTESPSAWCLQDAIGAADGPELRAQLLSGKAVELVQPDIGDEFVVGTMCDIEEPPVPGDQDKRVHAVCQPGVRFAGVQLLRSEVHCVTEDMALLQSCEHPISVAVVAPDSRYLSSNQDVRRGWRTDAGLRASETLDEEFGAEQVDAWAVHLASRFANLRYRPAHVAPNTDFAETRMDAVGAAPDGRSVVDQVLRPGLSNPDGFAIVRALVTTRSALGSS